MAKSESLKERFYGDLKADFEREGGDSFLISYLRKEGRNRAVEQLDEAIGQGAEVYMPLARRTLQSAHRLSLPKELRQALMSWESGKSFPLLEELHRAMVTALLTEDARTFLYDSRRKRERSLEMASAYYGSLPAVGESSQVSDETWEQLFFSLRGTGKHGVFIPVRIDRLSGAGLYIVGRRRLPGQLSRRDAAAVPPGLRGDCYYICLCPDEIARDEYDMTLCVRADDEEIARMCAFPSLKEASAWFDRNTVPYARETVQGWNGSPPPDCPPQLTELFSSRPDSRELSALRQAGMEAFRRDEEDLL